MAKKLAASEPQSLDASLLMDWAELHYPQFFPGHQGNQTFAPYTYRYYPGTQNYLGVDGDTIAVLGPLLSGNVVLTVGTLSAYACQVLIDDCTAPAIAQPPASLTVVSGRSASLSVTVDGGPSLAYQWLRDATPIAGANGDSYALPPAADADNGTHYAAQVSNAKGSVVSSAATLSVVPGVDDASARALAERRGCFSCHAVESSLGGPAFKDVGARYTFVPTPLAGMQSSIRFGSNGNWGASMAPQTQVSAAEAAMLATWILGLN